MRSIITGRAVGPAVVRRRPLRLAALPVVVAGLIGLAACGSTAATSTAGAAGTGATDDAFTACMAENGVTMPAGGPGSGGGTRPTGAPPTGSASSGSGSGSGGAPPAGTGETMAAPPGVDATTWAAAQKACASVAPTPPGGTAATATPSAGA